MTDFSAVEPGSHGLDGARPPLDLAAAGFTEAEYEVSGEALRYLADGLPSHGEWNWTAADSASFRTRVLIRRPVRDEDASSVVVCEWLNVSSGADAAPGWAYQGEEILRRGHVWVGVSAQYVGVHGGSASVSPIAGETPGLVGTDPDRYGNLRHPGDAYSYDLFTSVAAGLVESGGPLADLPDPTLLAMGQSQSAYALTSYYNGVQPHADVFDGFLIHSRGGAAAPTGEPDAGFNMIGMAAGEFSGHDVRLRTDLDAPVMIVQTETELGGHLNYLGARQPDHDRLRTWEIAGAAHADKWLIDEFEDFLGCEHPVNRGQQVFVLRAALAGLTRWIRRQTPPPHGDPLTTVSPTDPTLLLDAMGNASAGVRTPAVDVATAVLTGVGNPHASRLCRLFGQTTPIPAEELQRVYGSAENYLRAYESATEAAIDAGFMLPEDGDSILAQTDAARFDL